MSPAIPVEGFRLHADADDVIRRRFITRAALRRGVTRRAAGEWYDNELTDAQMFSTAASVGLVLVPVGGAFADWLANIDWDKLFAFIFKLIEMFMAFA